MWWLALGWLIVLIILYSRDIDLYRRILEWYDRWLYSRDFEEVIDQFWRGDTLYTTHIRGNQIKVNGEHIGYWHTEYKIDAMRHAWMWVDHKE